MKKTIEIKPITINKCWQGRRFKTPEYKAWRDTFSYLILRYVDKPIKECAIKLYFYIDHYETTDVDNLIKPTLDALMENQVIKDDKYIKSIEATKIKSKNEKIEIEIIPL